MYTTEEALSIALKYADMVIGQQDRIDHLKRELQYANDELVAEKQRTAPMTTKPWTSLTDAQKSAVTDWCLDHHVEFRGRKIDMIKTVRSIFPYMGLKDAKDRVDATEPKTKQEQENEAALNALREKLGHATNDYLAF